LSGESCYPEKQVIDWGSKIDEDLLYYGAKEPQVVE
jgi:hypothetical protein